MAEYTVVVGAIVAALLTPFSDGRNAIEMLEQAITKNYRGYSYAVSLSEYPTHASDEEMRRLVREVNETTAKLEAYTDPEQLASLVAETFSAPFEAFCNSWDNFPLGCF